MRGGPPKNVHALREKGATLHAVVKALCVMYVEILNVAPPPVRNPEYAPAILEHNGRSK